MIKMPERVRVMDGDTGEIYSGEGNEHGLVTRDENDAVLFAEAFIVAAQLGWTVLGLDSLWSDATGDLMVRRFEAYQGHPNPYTPCTRPSWMEPVGGTVTVSAYNTRTGKITQKVMKDGV